MSLAEARALVAGDSARASRLLLEEHDPLADRQALELLAERCHQFAPTVLLAAECTDALWLDVTGLAHLYGDEKKLLAQVAKSLRAEGWTAQLALAGSQAAAWALARFQATPQAPFCATAEETAQLLATLPVEALRLSPPIGQSLAELGFSEVGQLEQLSRAALAARFGPELAAQLDRLWGRRTDVLPSVRDAPNWETSFTFEGPVSDYGVLLHVLGRLIAELATQLARERLGATRVVVLFDCAPAEGLRLELRLFRASATARHWLELATLELERARLRAPVSTITVTATATGALELRQRELFPHAERAAESERLVGALVERLTSRLGHQAVSRVALVPEALPERSYRLSAAITGRKSAFKPLALSDLESWSRPLELFSATRHPLALRTADDGAPAEFRWCGVWHRVAQSWGPERIESGWWRGRRARRDYYRVETDEASQAWLYCRLDDERWFLHGWFI